MVILKGFNTCTIIDNRLKGATLDYKNTVNKRFLNKIVDEDLITAIEYYDNNTLTEIVPTGVEGGLTKVNSLKHLKLI